MLSRRARPIAAVVLALVALPLLAGTVLGHHPEIAATYGCDGVVTFTSTAWEGSPQPNPTVASRTNDKIGISWSADGGATWTDLPSNPSYHFDLANGFTFSDSFNAGGAASVIVRAVALVNWANGTPPEDGGPRQTDPISAPTDCATPTPTPTETTTTTETTATTETSSVQSTTTAKTETTSVQSSTTETTATTVTSTETGGVGGETGTPAVTPPSTSSLDGSSGSGDGWRVILLVLAGIAVLSLILLPGDRKSKQR